MPLQLESLLIVIKMTTASSSNLLQGPDPRRGVWKKMAVSHVSIDFGKEKGMGDGGAGRGGVGQRISEDAYNMSDIVNIL